jgi:cyclopropane fatty-acyl-phospholipid synthase-like methyltransferase
MTTTYRWNLTDFATGYDQSAHHVHPHYVEVQDAVLAALPFGECDEFLLVDAGGGSGRLVERFLDRFTSARAIVLDQSEAFLALAERKLARFGERAACRIAQLQGDWPQEIGEPIDAVVSMSAIHHLESAEKQQLFARIFAALNPGGVFINGDEVRPASDAEYLAEVSNWAAHMHRIMDAGLVPDSFKDALLKWEARNVGEFSKPKHTGDDCHDTIDEQLAWLAECGYVHCRATWHKAMWAVMAGDKP